MLHATKTPESEEDVSCLPLEQALAALCKASSDPLRLQVLRVLREDSFGVSELCSIFDIRQPALSHHLKVLASAALVATRSVKRIRATFSATTPTSSGHNRI